MSDSREWPHWTCSICKFDNDILNNHCRICQSYKPPSVTGLMQAQEELKRDIFIARIESYEYPSKLKATNEAERKRMTEQEELFAKYYNEETILVKDMDIPQLREHRDELSKIAFEAKARLVCSDKELRDRTAGVKNKSWLLTNDNTQTTSDAINAPKVRQARMSKLDKMRADLSKYLDKDTVDKMMREMERKTVEKDVNVITFKPSPAMEKAIEEKEKVKIQTNPFAVLKPLSESEKLQETIEEAKEQGIITDSEPVVAKPNPFAHLKKAN